LPLKIIEKNDGSRAERPELAADPRKWPPDPSGYAVFCSRLGNECRVTVDVHPAVSLSQRDKLNRLLATLSKLRHPLAGDGQRVASPELHGNAVREVERDFESPRFTINTWDSRMRCAPVLTAPPSRNGLPRSFGSHTDRVQPVNSAIVIATGPVEA
jgi:hypothetical protein